MWDFRLVMIYVLMFVIVLTELPWYLNVGLLILQISFCASMVWEYFRG